MKVVRPLTVTDAMLISSSVPELYDHAAWSASTTYGIGQRAVRLHRIFESTIAGNLNIDPAVPGSAWLDVGPVTRWAMFDPAAGPRTTWATTLTVVLAPGMPIRSLGMFDLAGASVRVQVSAGGPNLYDQTRANPGPTLTFLDLPAVATPTITVTITPTAGAAAIGKLILGNAVDLGATETGPTVSLTDFSRRETDEFGVTTVVERAWAKRVALRSRLASSEADAVQRTLAAIRATPALWIGEEGFEALTLYGFYKDFAIDLQLGDTTYCSLTIEGLPEAAANIAVVDPAPSGASDFRVVRPATITGTVFQTSTVPENDYPEWNALTNYGLGNRVIKAATHRIYESTTAGNVGNDPATGAAQWIDVGATNRWAMFDDSLGSATTATSQIVVTLMPAAATTALAILDTDAASVRVQAPGYDRTQNTTAGAVTVTALTFLDLAVAAGATITITITATGVGLPVSVGTLMIGAIEPLGIIETSPQLSIADFSRQETDDFGNTTPIERAWAKRMAVRSLVATPAVDGLMRRIASLRAVPALWLGQEGFDTLAVYGFYRDFSVEIGELLSTTSVTIEGLSKATPLIPAEPPIRFLGDWEAGESYPKNAVLRFGGRSFASLVDNNIGHQPPATATDDAYWYAVSDRGADGTDGSNGAPGAPGANGQTTYVHFAWANSADGATGFSTTVSAGKLYIGVYTDFLEPDSTNPALYSWTKIKGEDGLQGTQGVAGPPGTNGQTTYFHIAYADNSTGTLNFTTGDAGARTYIGVYTDFSPADSSNPAAYTWSKYVGADGSNGTPGAPGANGQTSYVHFAWANSSDGTVGFSTTVSAGKLYIGAYSDFTLADSSNPAVYHWTLIKGATGAGIVTLVNKANTEVEGAKVTKVSGGSDWNASAHSLEGYSGNVQAAAEIVNAGGNVMVGLNDDPDSSAGYTDGIYAYVAAGAFYAYLNGGGYGPYGAAVPNGAFVFARRRGANFEFGVLGEGPRFTIATASFGISETTKLYFDTSLHGVGMVVNSCSLLPLGIDGLNGTNGIPGAPGANGQTSYVHFAYANSADGTVAFTTGSSDGRFYVGVYVDFTPADSTNPASYTWSLQRGADGANGTPGAPGSNGQPSYVHIAYANNASGTQDFSLSDPTGRTYIGVYTDFTLADSSNPALYSWSLIKGADGSPGAPGVSPIALDLSVYAMDVAADSNNVTKAGALPKGSVVSLTQAGGALTPSSVNFTYSDGGAGAFAADYGVVANTVRLTTANAPGWIDVNVVYAGVTYTKRIAISRTQDPQPPPSQTSAFTAVVGGDGAGATTYNGAGILSPELVLKANGAGQINAAASGEYYTDQPGASVRTLVVAMRIEIAPQSTGVFSAPLSESIGSQAFWDKVDATPGIVSTSGTFTGLTPDASYRIRVNTRKVSGSNPSVFINDGALSVSQ